MGINELKQLQITKYVLVLHSNNKRILVEYVQMIPLL